jgi:hypothetical protein
VVPDICQDFTQMPKGTSHTYVVDNSTMNVTFEPFADCKLTYKLEMSAKLEQAITLKNRTITIQSFNKTLIGNYSINVTAYTAGGTLIKEKLEIQVAIK